jgi:GDPmannose 4,6-dehydratase
VRPVEALPTEQAFLAGHVAAPERPRLYAVYNLGAISFVQLSFKQAELTAEITGLGVLRMLEAVRIVGGIDNNPIRFYQASSSEMFGKVRETPQNEGTPFHPRSPYGVAKAYGHFITVNYRESYGIFACIGILFNHESPRRASNFVTSKIIKNAVLISMGKAANLELGNWCGRTSRRRRRGLLSESAD